MASRQDSGLFIIIFFSSLIFENSEPTEPLLKYIGLRGQPQKSNSSKLSNLKFCLRWFSDLCFVGKSKACSHIIQEGLAPLYRRPKKNLTKGPSERKAKGREGGRTPIHSPSFQCSIGPSGYGGEKRKSGETCVWRQADSRSG